MKVLPYNGPMIEEASVTNGQLRLEISGGLTPATIIVDARALAPLAHATDEQLAEVKALGNAVYFPRLDAEFATVGLLERVLGLRSLHGHLAQAGAVRSEAKAAAVRGNGAKGGRPRKKPSE